MMDVIEVLILVTAVISAIAYQTYAGAPEDSRGWPVTLIKTMAVGGLALVYVLGGQFQMFGGAGLALGALGDFFLSRPGKGSFLAGMVAFGLGHLAYALAFAGFFLFDAEGGLARGAALPMEFWVMAGVVTLLLISAEFWLAPHTGDLRRPVRLYGLAIATMGLAVTLVPWMEGILFVGTVLFIFSDMVLASRLFVLRGPQHKRTAGLILWPAYVSAQLLIFWALSGSWGHLYIMAKG